MATLTEAEQELTDMMHRPGVTWDEVRRVINTIARDRGEWGGYPIPVPHTELHLEPRFPMVDLHNARVPASEEEAKQMRDTRHVDTADTVTDDFRLVNSWYVRQRSCWVHVTRENGRVRKYFEYDGTLKRLDFTVNTLGVAAECVWSVEAEMRAERKLQELTSAHAFKCYKLCGMFIETSKRSGVQYIFRKLRPTLALSAKRGDGSDPIRPLATLCLHPLGYYAKSWAGVMCPTDDVIAHLVMMRADEHQFWKKANHHDPHWASAGI